MSILDSVLDATDFVVISEQNDFGAIDARESLVDGPEMAKILASMTAEQREEWYAKNKAMAQKLAVKRADLDMTNGRISVFVAGKPAWHKLGVNVSHAVSSKDAINLANINWVAEKIQLAYDFNGQCKIAEGVYAIVRKDTGKMLGTTGSRYQPMQNAEGFEFLDTVLSEFGAKYESAGAIHGGKQVFMLANLPKHRFTVNGKDSVEAYVQFSLDHSGGGANWAFPISNRTECANTFRVAMQSKNSGISIRHDGNQKQRINDARLALGLAVQEFSEFKDAAEVMAKKPINIKHYARDVLDAILNISEAKAMMGADVLAATMAKTEAERKLLEKSFAKKIERRGEILNEVLERHEQSANGINGMRGTAWAGFNAVTETVNHGSLAGRYRGSEDEKASRRLESVLQGDGDNIMQVAFAKAMA